MAYSDTISLVQGDRRPNITVQLRDRNTALAGATLDEGDSDTWAYIDLTDCTVRLHVREIGSTTLLETLTGTVTNATTGLALFTFSETTLADAGQYEAEIEIEDATGYKQTVYELIKFKVRAQIA